MKFPALEEEIQLWGPRQGMIFYLNQHFSNFLFLTIFLLEIIKDSKKFLFKGYIY